MEKVQLADRQEDSVTKFIMEITWLINDWGITMNTDYTVAH